MNAPEPRPEKKRAAAAGRRGGTRPPPILGPLPVCAPIWCAHTPRPRPLGRRSSICKAGRRSKDRVTISDSLRLRILSDHLGDIRHATCRRRTPHSLHIKCWRTVTLRPTTQDLAPVHAWSEYPSRQLLLNEHWCRPRDSPRHSHRAHESYQTRACEASRWTIPSSISSVCFEDG